MLKAYFTKVKDDPSEDQPPIFICAQTREELEAHKAMIDPFADVDWDLTITVTINVPTPDADNR